MNTIHYFGFYVIKWNQSPTTPDEEKLKIKSMTSLKVKAYQTVNNVLDKWKRATDTEEKKNINKRIGDNVMINNE